MQNEHKNPGTNDAKRNWRRKMYADELWSKSCQFSELYKYVCKKHKTLKLTQSRQQLQISITEIIDNGKLLSELVPNSQYVNYYIKI